MGQVRLTSRLTSWKQMGTRPAACASRWYSDAEPMPRKRPSRQIGSRRNRRSQWLGVSRLSHAQTTKRPPGFKTRAVSVKNTSRSAMCSELSIASYGVKGGRLEVVCQPIAQQIGRVGRLWVKAHRMLMLSCRDSQPRDLCAIVACQDSRGSTIAAADVTHSIPGTHAGLCGDLRDQTIGCLFGRLLTRTPEAMVNVLTPDFTIETVEIVIVSRDFTGLKWWLWLDHVVAVLTSKTGCLLADSDDRCLFAAEKILPGSESTGNRAFLQQQNSRAGGFDSRW